MMSADPRFFDVAGPFTLAWLAERSGARLADGVDGDQVVTGIGPLDVAGPGDLSFLENKRYLPDFETTKAGACLVHPAFAFRAPAGTAVLLAEKPYRSYALAAQAFFPKPPVTPGISPAAHVSPGATVDPSAAVEPGAVIEEGAEIGARARIAANAVVARNVVVGADSSVGPGASLTHCLIGERVTIYAGARIGQDGFGFAMDAEGHLRIPQTGRVVVEDDVEIGANATIDRGAGHDTVIRRGAMIDNLVQIGHNVEVGPGSVIVAQAGVAGSTKLGAFVVLAAQTGLAGHLRIGAGAKLAASSGVMRDIPAGEEWAGTPAMPARKFWRNYAKLMKLLEGKG
jgi:UDP-3-O-[3-hydroxymyristoyl] glucosamine N-acyltransferase